MLSDTTPALFAARCPAKINWFLDVSPPRNDGYHPLQTVMQSIGLYDYIQCVPRSDTRIVCIDTARSCRCPPEKTTVARAAALLRDACGITRGVTITLHKQIPVGAGLGGGSSDAAAALSLLCRLWNLSLSSSDLLSLATRIGADVPFFLGSPAAFCSGIGEIISALNPVELPLVLWKPRASLSTSTVYARFDQAVRPRQAPADFLSAYASGCPATIAPVLWNNLALAARECLPALDAMLATARARGARAAWITGSGPTIVCLCDDPPSAAQLYASLRRAAPPADFLLSTKTLVSPPAPVQV